MEDFKEKVKFFIYTLDLGETALLQLAAIALGILLGINLPSRSKKIAGALSVFGLIATVLPIGVRFFKEVVQDKEADSYDMDDDCFEIVE